jgi:hypothetical protein
MTPIQTSPCNYSQNSISSSENKTNSTTSPGALYRKVLTNGYSLRLMPEKYMRDQIFVVTATLDIVYSKNLSNDPAERNFLKTLFLSYSNIAYSNLLFGHKGKINCEKILAFKNNSLEQVTDSTKNDLLFVLAIVIRSGLQLKFASSNLKQNPFVVFAAASNNPEILHYVTNQPTCNSAQKK